MPPVIPPYYLLPKRERPIIVKSHYDQHSVEHSKVLSIRCETSEALKPSPPTKLVRPTKPTASTTPTQVAKPIQSTKPITSNKPTESVTPTASSGPTTSIKSIATPEPTTSCFPNCVATQRFPDWSKLTDVLACDTEFLDWKPDSKHKTIGSVTIVNERLEVVYDVFADYGGFGTDDWPVHNVHEHLNMLHAKDMDPANGARPIAEIQANLATILEGRTVVFHSGGSDVRAIGNGVVDWRKVKVLDTSTYEPWFCFASKNTTGVPQPKLKTLAWGVLGRKIQGKGHNSKEDAEATMALRNEEREAFDEQYANGPAVHDYYSEVANPPKASRNANKKKRTKKSKAAKKAEEAKTSAKLEEQDSAEEKVDSGIDTELPTKDPVLKPVYINRAMVEHISSHIKAAAALLRDQAATFRFGAELEKFERRAIKANAGALELSRLAWKLTSGMWQLWHGVEGVDKMTPDEKIGVVFEQTPLDSQLVAMDLTVVEHLEHVEKYCISMMKRHPDERWNLEGVVATLHKTQNSLREMGLRHV